MAITQALRFYVFTQMITVQDGSDQIVSDGGVLAHAGFVRTPAGWRVSRLSGGMVWWSGSVPSHLPWWGIDADRFDQ